VFIRLPVLLSLLTAGTVLLGPGCRYVAAQQPRLPGDLAPQTGAANPGSNPDNFALVGDRVFFTASGQGAGLSTESIHVRSMRQDGTDLRDHGRIDDPSGNQSVIFTPSVLGSDYFIGVGSSSLRMQKVFAVLAEDVSPRLVIDLDDGDGYRSFRVLGTPSTTYLLAQGFSRSSIYALRPSEPPERIYRRNLAISPDVAGPIFAATIGNSLVFDAPTASFDAMEPWVSDGTAAGTRQLATLAPGVSGGSNPGQMAFAGGRAVFDAGTASVGRAFYTTDGTAEGTVVLVSWAALGSSGGSQVDVQSIDGKAYFVRTASLVVSDGTIGGTWRVDRTADGQPLSQFGAIRAIVNGRLLFTARVNGSSSAQLCAMNLTTRVVNPITSFARTLALPAASALPVLSHATLVITAGSFPVAQVFGLIRTDGTVAGTTIEDAPLNGFLRPGSFKPLNVASGAAIFSGWRDVSGALTPPRDFEPWITNSEPSRVNLLTDVLPPPPDGGVRQLGKLGDLKVIASGGRPFTVAASADSASPLAELRVSTIGSPWAELPGGALLASSPPDNRLYFTHGTPSSTHPVFQSGAAGPVSPGNLARVGDLVYFTDSGSGSRLWKSDGTEAGTTVVFADPAVTIRDVTAFAEQAWFFGRTTSGYRVYRTDGTTTILVSATFSTNANATPRFIGQTATQLFATTDSSTGVSSFSAAGTAATITTGSFARSYTVDASGLLGIIELPQRLIRWQGGTTPFTVLSSAPMPGSYSIGPTYRHLGVLPGKIIFTRFSDNEGEEVYAFDEASSETRLLRDVVPGSNGSSITKMQTVGNRVVWAARTPGQGFELWSTDGTQEGTRPIAPVNASQRSSVQAEINVKSDDRFALVGTLMLFGADDGMTGEEPWVVALCPADFNSDGAATPDDMADYIGAFFSVPPPAAADIDGNGLVDPDDLADFIGVYFGGCE